MWKHSRRVLSLIKVAHCSTLKTQQIHYNSFHSILKTWVGVPKTRIIISAEVVNTVSAMYMSSARLSAWRFQPRAPGA